MIQAEDFMHPDDRTALNALKAIPGFGTVVKGFMNYGVERLVHGTNMASKIRLSPTQLPEIYDLLPPICRKLGIEVPEFYLQMNPFPNAYTLGDSIISVTVTSGLLESLNKSEVKSALAHECGHIACRHCLYQTMARLLLGGVDIFSLIKGFPLARTALIPVRYALLHWYRQSELSADRAAALVSGVEATVSTQVRLSGGPRGITKNINIEEWAQQADDYDSLKSDNKWDKALQIFASLDKSHPFSAVRVREILSWSKTDEFQKLAASLGQKSRKSRKGSQDEEE